MPKGYRDPTSTDDILRMYSEGHSRNEIAEQLGTNIGLVSTRMATIRKRYKCRTNEELMYRIGRYHGQREVERDMMGEADAGQSSSE